MKPSLQTSRGRSLFFSYTSITQNFELRWQYLKITSSITSWFGDQSGWSKKWALCTLWPSISGWTARYQDNAPASFFVSCPPSKSWWKKVGAVRKSWRRIKRRWRANIQLFNAAWPRIQATLKTWGEEENFLFGLFTRADKWQRGASSSSILCSHKSRPTAHRGASRVFNAGVKPEGGAITRTYGKLCWLNGRPLRADWPKIWIAVGTVRHVECIWPLAEQDSFLGRSKEPLLHWKSRRLRDTSLKAIIWKEKKKKFL